LYLTTGQSLLSFSQSENYKTYDFEKVMTIMKKDFLGGFDV